MRLIADEMCQYAEAVTNFSVASNRSWTGQDGEKHEQMVWYRVSAWNRLVEICNQYLSKGRQVYVGGELRPDENGGPRVWEANDGSPRASFEVTARTVQFLGGRNGRSDAPDAPAYEPIGEQARQDGTVEFSVATAAGQRQRVPRGVPRAIRRIHGR